MGSTTRNALYMAVSVVFFMAALLMGIYLFTNISETIDATYKINANQDHNLQTALKTTGDGTVSSGVVLQTIYQIQQTGIPVQVNYYPAGSNSLQSVTFPANLVIDSETASPTYTATGSTVYSDAVSQIDVTKQYTPLYQRDSSGNVVEITFTSK